MLEKTVDGLLEVRRLIVLLSLSYLVRNVLEARRYSPSYLGRHLTSVNSRMSSIDEVAAKLSSTKAHRRNEFAALTIEKVTSASETEAHVGTAETEVVGGTHRATEELPRSDLVSVLRALTLSTTFCSNCGQTSATKRLSTSDNPDKK